jgi:hypothetical protein
MWIHLSHLCPVRRICDFHSKNINSKTQINNYGTNSTYRQLPNHLTSSSKSNRDIFSIFLQSYKITTGCVIPNYNTSDQVAQYDRIKKQQNCGDKRKHQKVGMHIGNCNICSHTFRFMSSSMLSSRPASPPNAIKRCLCNQEHITDHIDSHNNGFVDFSSSKHKKSRFQIWKSYEHNRSWEPIKKKNPWVLIVSN